MKKQNTKPLAAAIGLAMAGTLAAGSAVAAENPFGLSELDSGYMQLASAHGAGEGKCGEGKCGGEKSTMEGKCGEGKCGGEKSSTEGKCGGSQ